MFLFILPLFPAALLILHVLYRAYFSALSKFPNAHFLAPLTSLWIIYIKYTQKENQLRSKLHAELGPVVRLGPEELSISDPGSVKVVYRGGFEKTGLYEVFSNYGQNVMFSTVGSKLHAERKRMLSHVYSKSHIQTCPSLVAILDTTITNVKTELQFYVSEGRVCDFYKLTKSFGLDVTSAYLFGLGQGTNCIQSSRHAKPLQGFEKSLNPDVLFLPMELPRVYALLERIGIRPFSEEVPEYKKSIEDMCFGMCEKAKKVMEEKKMLNGSYNEKTSSDGASYPTVYAQLYNKLQESGVPPEKLDESVAAEMLDHMLAGNELIGTTLSYVIWQLSNHPEMHHRLQEEIKAYPNSLHSAQVIDSLPVLDAVLQETMRLHPGSWGPFPRVVPPNGAQIEGVDIPAGTVISTSTYSLHQNATVFPRPDEWRPERWLNASMEEKRELMRWFWAFGSGGRMCIGNHLAIRMMKAFVFDVYTKFEGSLVMEKMPEQLDGLQAIPDGNEVFMKFRQIC